MSDQQSGVLPILLLLAVLLLALSGLNWPTPSPDPPPVTARELMVLIVEETAQRTPALADLLLSEQWRAQVTALGHRWRVVDQHATESDGTPARVLAPWRALPALPSGQSRVLPWVLLVDSAGFVLSEGPLPSSESALVDLVRKHTKS